MALVLTAHGDSVTLDHFNVASASQTRRLDLSSEAQLRRGSDPMRHGLRDGPQQVRVDGFLKGVSGTDIAARVDAMTAVLGGGNVLIEDTVLDRFAVCQRTGLQVSLEPPWVARLSIDLLVVDGVWTDAPGDAPELTTAVVASDKLTRYAVVDLGGNAAVLPSILFELDAAEGTDWEEPQVEWRGPNILGNSSFEAGTDPTGWTVDAGALVVSHYGRTGGRCAQVYASGTDYQGVSQEIEVSAGTQYTLSTYARTLGTDATLRFQVQELSSTDAALAAAVTADVAVSGQDWTRAAHTMTSNALAAAWEIALRCVTAGERLDVDDVQLEEGASASPFVDTDDAQWRPASFERRAAGSYEPMDTSGLGNPDRWSVDCTLGRAMVMYASDWAWDNQACNGHYFDLRPGRNHLFVSTPATGSVTVKVHHPRAWS